MMKSCQTVTVTATRAETDREAPPTTNMIKPHCSPLEMETYAAICRPIWAFLVFAPPLPWLRVEGRRRGCGDARLGRAASVRASNDLSCLSFVRLKLYFGVVIMLLLKGRRLVDTHLVSVHLPLQTSTCLSPREDVNRF